MRVMVMPNVRFGSQAALLLDITPTAASEGKAVIHMWRFRESLDKRLLSPIADINLDQINVI